MNGDDDSIELLTVREAADVLRLSVPETYARIRSGAIPAIRLSERGLRVPRRAIDELIEKALRGAR